MQAESCLILYARKLTYLEGFQARSLGVAWSGRCHPRATGCQHFVTSGNFLQYFLVALSLELGKRSPEYTVELNLSFCSLLENSIFSAHTLSI